MSAGFCSSSSGSGGYILGNNGDGPPRVLNMLKLGRRTLATTILKRIVEGGDVCPGDYTSRSPVPFALAMSFSTR